MERRREGAVRVGTHHIVEAYAPALKEDLPREAIDKGKPELEHKQRDGRETNSGGRKTRRVRNNRGGWHDGHVQLIKKTRHE